MEEIYVYTILYYENGQFYMTSMYAFLSCNAAVNCAKKFCDSHKKGVWTYEIEQLSIRCPKSKENLISRCHEC